MCVCVCVCVCMCVCVYVCVCVCVCVCNINIYLCLFIQYRIWFVLSVRLVPAEEARRLACSQHVLQIFVKPNHVGIYIDSPLYLLTHVYYI